MNTLADLFLAAMVATAVHGSALRFEQQPGTLLERVLDAVINLGPVISAQLPDVAAGPPAFCNKLDCPKYAVVKKTDDYEERRYDASHWVSTSMNGIDYTQAIFQMFMKLFHYIQGNNVKGEKIAMTAPVIVRVIPGQGPACENNFTMSFFVAPVVSAPPSPKDKTVYINSMPTMTAYVRSFSGFATLSDYLQQAEALGTALPSSAAYHKDYYYTAGYDAPFKLFKRHNEVWFIGQ